MKKNIHKKKGLSEMVSISLLLLVAIIVFLSLQSWYYKYYQDSVQGSIENSYKDLEVLAINSTGIYIKNPNGYSFTLEELYIEKTLCSTTGSIIGNRITNFSTSTCPFTINQSIVTVVLITNVYVFSDNVVIHTQIN